MTLESLNDLKLDKRQVLKLMSRNGYELKERKNAWWDQFAPSGDIDISTDKDYPIYKHGVFCRDKGKYRFYDYLQGQNVSILYYEELRASKLWWLEFEGEQLCLSFQ